MAILKAINSGGKRRELDYYPTPPEATRALLPLIEHWPKKIWEPCCGDGAISKILEGLGWYVFSTDLVDHGYGHTYNDFFDYDVPPSPQAIITNPPFGRADEFIRHANAIGIERMALLLKINFWSAKKRLPLWNLWQPYLIAPLTWRLDFTGAGAPHTDCMWCLWNRDGLMDSNMTSFQPLQKPAQDNIMPEAA